MAKMTLNDSLSLKIVLNELQRNTEKHSLNFQKLSILVKLERKNDFSGNLARYDSPRIQIPSDIKWSAGGTNKTVVQFALIDAAPFAQWTRKSNFS